MSDQPNHVASQTPQTRLGRLLCALRLAKKIEPVELARTLILSPAQITAIENGSQASFHNQSFYLRALKKYIAHMNLAMDPQASQLFTEIETELLSASTKINTHEVNLLIHAGLAHSVKTYLPQLKFKKAYFFWISLIVLVLVGVAAALTEGWPEKQAKKIELVSTSTPAKKVNPAPEVVVSQEQKLSPAAPIAVISPTTQPSASKTPEPPPPPDSKPTETPEEPQAAMLRLTFSAPSWVQVVEQNGKRIEKVFTPQDALELDPATLATLVIGNARESKLFTNAAEVDLSKYINPGSGVARFNQSDIMKIAQ